MATMTRFRLRALAVIVVVAGGCGYAVYDSYRAAGRPQPLIGMVRRTEVRIAPRISGRLGEISVKAGAPVASGAVVATLEAPELTAGLVEANAAAASAAADRANVYSGVRQEEQAIAASAIETADANVALATEERDRATTLAAKGFATGERLDQANANFAATSAVLAMKKAAYAEAVAGPTREERGIADVRVKDAKAGAAATDARLGETRLTAPVDGVVKTVVGELGEIVRAGQPVVTITARGAPWFSFTIREDRLGAIRIGATLKVLRSDGKETMARVTELRPLGDFATWQATRAVGDHDLSSFAVRLEPTSSDDDDLEPGMTVWLVGAPA